MDEELKGKVVEKNDGLDIDCPDLSSEKEEVKQKENKIKKNLKTYLVILLCISLLVGMKYEGSLAGSKMSEQTLTSNIEEQIENHKLSKATKVILVVVVVVVFVAVYSAMTSGEEQESEEIEQESDRYVFNLFDGENSGSESK